MIFHEYDIHRKVGYCHTSNRQNRFKTENVIRDKDGHFIMINGTIHQKDIICQL